LQRFEAGADVCSTEWRVGPLSKALLENGETNVDAIWHLAYPRGSPVSLQRNQESINHHLAAMHDRDQ